MHTLQQKISFKKSQETFFKNRYINPNTFYTYLKKHYSNYISQIGTSTQGLPIYLLSLGSGNQNVLAWTQMHGNETTPTLALVDILNAYNQKNEFVLQLFQLIQLDIIFMLNPDGALHWERRNALGIDINRDFIANSSVEISVLKEQLKCKNYNFALNLHDQRTIYNVKGTHNPATISLLAPAADIDKTITKSRKIAMNHIVSVYNQLQSIIPNAVARYNDDFYPKSCGDNIQKLGIPTLLFEGGFSYNDYNRDTTRQAYFYALLSFFNSISSCIINDYTDYFSIPENDSIFNDIHLKNLCIIQNNKSTVLDVAIQYKETVDELNQVLKYIPIIEEIGDLSPKKAWKVIDANEVKCSVNSLKIGDNASFLLNGLNESFNLPNF